MLKYPSVAGLTGPTLSLGNSIPSLGTLVLVGILPDYTPSDYTIHLGFYPYRELPLPVIYATLIQVVPIERNKE